MSKNTSTPSVMNIKSIPTSTAQMVESDVLESLSFSQSEAVWEFSPKGFLHPSSTISLGFVNKPALDNCFPFINVGIEAIVRRAVLRTTAGRVICDTEDWNHLQGVKSLLQSNSGNKERESFLSGKQTCFGIIYDDDSSTKSTNGYGLENSLDYDTHETPKGLMADPHLKHSAGSQFQIKLHQLFPYMKAGNQLPLFMLPDERIQVQLFFNDEKERIAMDKNGADADLHLESLELDRKQCKVIADYIFYDGETMEKFKNDNKSLTFQYIDYRLSKQSLTNTQTQNNVRNVGGNGMVVNKLYYCYNDPNDTAKTQLTGKTGVVATRTAGDGKEVLSSNVFINSQFLYPQFVDNTARHFHNLKETQGMIPFISRQAYSGEGSRGISNVAAQYFEGFPQADQFSGRWFWQGFNLSNLNKRVDNRGIELHTKAVMPDISASAVTSFTQRCWLEIQRYVVIENGHLETYYV